jgi:acetyl-CoA carboxylase biotin carboxylase subunit
MLEKNPIQTITKVLIANRGEIALRIMKTAHEMGISTVAVYSEADKDAPFARFANEAICIGPSPSSESYLVGAKIIDAALQTNAQAIHPGYGFLSENADFSKKARAAGLIFIGPSEEAMVTMGSKLAAKETVKSFDVPLVPGTDFPIHTVEQALEIAPSIGFPLLIKASAGGGGKGMRIVHSLDTLSSSFERAVSEAVNSFGDGAVFLEKFVTSPRHIEIQILADGHGNIVHLFDRECSIQRRHQKVIEEAPSSVLNDELRNRMGAAAIEVAHSCNYVGAGTVEFLLDADMKFYFLEMNTRLQVEHPVTECITGVDLVFEQIRIAEGHPLRFSQDELEIRGHAVEVRVYAENAAAGFLPDTGVLKRYVPATGPGIRVDDGVEQGQEVSIHYDPMLSKLVAYGSTREAAIDRCIKAIDSYEITGVSTTLDFGRFALSHPAFRSGKFDTQFVDLHFSPEKLNRTLECSSHELAELTVGLIRQKRPEKRNTANKTSKSNWTKRRFE